ncbi:hypothetical protein PR202_gb15185 [Eleusine coracana subsp. coracana]|uniref:DUF642 domain-containing protein n=1 Tax=Eleusine coracana subsp. coracana TaxID=191504 RepID=A0AAV5EXL8_ELECO|nr:hypothetical protein PR202_gb15185 [Eleusine coracana subsp. coracana]
MDGSTVTGETAVPKWKSSGHVEYVESGQRQGDFVLAVPEGARAVRLGNGASVQQQLAVTPGAYYSITFSAARTCAHAQKLMVSVVPGSQAGGVIPVQTVYSSAGWDSYSWAFKAESGAVAFVIRNPGQEDDPTCGPIIDAVSIKTLNTPQATQSNNLIKNGDFEEGPYISEVYQWGALVPPTNEDGEVTPLPGWKIMSYSKSVKYVGAAGFAVPRGGRAVELVSGVETALVQDVETVKGGSYRLEFAVGDAEQGGCAASDSPAAMEVRAYAAEGNASVPWGGAQAQGFARGSLEFTAVGPSTRVVLVSSGYHTRADGSGALCGPVVDDVSLVRVSSQPQARRLLRR